MPELLLVGEEAGRERRGQHAAEVARSAHGSRGRGRLVAHHQLVGADALAPVESPAEHRRVHPDRRPGRATSRRSRLRPTRGAGTPRRAATARARRCAGARRRRRRSRCGPPRPAAARRPRRAARSPPRRRGPTAPRGRRASATSACSLVHQRGDAAQRVELLPLRARPRSPRRCRGSRRAVPATSPLHAADRGRARRRGRRAARRGSNSRREPIGEHGAPAVARGLDLRALRQRAGPAPARTAASPPTAPSRGARGRGRRRTARTPRRSPLEPLRAESSYSVAVPSTS